MLFRSPLDPSGRHGMDSGRGNLRRRRRAPLGCAREREQRARERAEREGEERGGSRGGAWRARRRCLATSCFSRTTPTPPDVPRRRPAAPRLSPSLSALSRAHPSGARRRRRKLPRPLSIPCLPDGSRGTAIAFCVVYTNPFDRGSPVAFSPSSSPTFGRRQPHRRFAAEIGRASCRERV